MNVFKATPDNPFHVSVGAIIRDGGGNYILINSGDRHSFMCGTIEQGETPQEALRRELFEEMGAYGHVKRFAGTSVIDATWETGAQFAFQKCILWFDVELSILDPADATDPQGSIVIVTPGQLSAVNQDHGRWPHGLTLN